MTYKEELLRLKFGDRQELVDGIKSAIEQGVLDEKSWIAYISYHSDTRFIESWLSVNGFNYEVDDEDECIFIQLNDFLK